MPENRDEIFSRFLKDNPTFESPSGHHRRLADWAYDTLYREKVARKEMTFEAALTAASKKALETLPIQHDHMTEASLIVAEIALSRNKPISQTVETPLSEDSVAARLTVAEMAAARGQTL